MDNVKYLRWDHAPLHLYYEQTRLLLEPVLEEISVFEATLGNGTNPTAKMYIEQLYNTFIQILADSANATIPKYAKKILKILVESGT